MYGVANATNHISLNLWVQDLDTGEYLFPALGGGDGEGDTILSEAEISELPGGGESSSADGLQIPKHRFDEVNGKFRDTQAQLEKYAKYGTPEEIEAAVKKAEQVYSESDLKQFDEQIMRIPAFKKVNEFVERQTQDQQTLRDQFLTTGESKFSGFAKELNLPEDSKFTRTLQAMVTEEIRQDPQLLVRFRNSDPSCFDDGFKRIKEGFVGTLRRKRNANVEQVKQRGPSQPTSSRAIGNLDTRKVVEEHALTEQQKLAAAATAGFERLRAREEQPP